MNKTKHPGFEGGKESAPLPNKGSLFTAGKTPLPVLEHHNGGQGHGR